MQCAGQKTERDRGAALLSIQLLVDADTSKICMEEHTLKRPGPGCAVWETTLRCNLNCIHCGSAAGTARKDELSTAEALDLCVQLKSIGTQGVAMMGGEPFTRRDWPQIASRIRELGMELSIITNGFAISESTFDKLKQIGPELVTVSIDGASSEVHDHIRGKDGSFDEAVSTLARFLEMGLPTGVITTVHKLNLQELKGIRQLLLRRGVAWQIQMATPYGRLTQEYVLSKKEFYSVAMFIAHTRESYSKSQIMVAGAHDMGYFSKLLPPVQLTPWRGCQAGISTLGVQSDGTVRGCLALPESFNEGNVRDQTLHSIWNSPEFSSYTRRVKPEDLQGHCRSCAYHRACKGGCSAVSHSLTGKLHNDPYCLHHIEATGIIK